MGLENILKNFKTKLITSAFLGSLLIGCSGSQGNITQPQPPNPPKPPKPQPQNHAPVWISNPVTQVDEQRSHSDQCQAVDSDGDNLTYSFEVPSWLSVNPQTCLISGTAPEVLQNTNFSIRRKVSDGKAPSVEQTYILTVNNLFNTYLLTTGQTNNLLQVTSSNLVFSQPMNFALNDVIGAGISTLTPNGILREITSISSDKKTVYTSQASLEKILKKATLLFTKSLSPSDIQSVNGLQGVSPFTTANLSGFNFCVNLNNVVLYDRDGNQNTKSDQVIADGEICFNTDFSFNVDIDDFALKYLKFQNITKEVADITIGSNLIGIAVKKEVKITELKFNPFIIGYLPTPIPIPLVVTPKIGVYVGMDPTQVNPLGFRVRQEASLDARLVYNGSWSKGADFTNSFDFSIFNPTGNWDLKVYAGPRLEMLLYDIAGPVAGANGKLRLNSQSGGDWKLYGGFEAYIGILMQLFSKTIAAHSEKVFDYEKLLAEKGTQPLPVKTDTIRLSPSSGKDAFVRLNVFPDGTKTYQGFNTPDLDVEKNYWSPPAGAEMETLIQPPSLTIPPNSDIVSAKLVLYGNGIFNITGSSARIDAKKVLTPWEESTVKWNSKPLYGETVSSSVVYDNLAKNYEWDITSLVKSWFNGQITNNGLALSTIDNPDGIARFNSREHSDASKRPMLIVTYRQP